MAKRKYTYGKGSSEWEKPGDPRSALKIFVWLRLYSDPGV